VSFNVFRNRVAVMSLAGVLAVGALGGGAAIALNGGNGSATAPTAAVVLAQSSPAPSTSNGSSATGNAAKTPRKAVLRGLYGDIVKQSGLTKSDLQTGFKAGQSIDDLITAKKGNPATVKAAVLTDLATKVQAAVSANKLTPEQATKITTKAPAVVDSIMSAKGGPARQAIKKMLHARKELIDVAATTLNIPAATLQQDLKQGQTIAQVAGSQASAVITAAQSKANDAIDAAVSNGKLDPARATTLKTKADTWISNFVNNGPKHKTANP
jgi:hypothetical protein